MSHVWPTSTEAINAANWILIIGGIALALLAITYTLDWMQDRWQRRVDVAHAKALEQLQGDMAQRRAQAKGPRR
jgi:hypothetical protein